MTTITCDMCKKPIQDAERDVNYYTIRSKDICRSCKKDFDRKVEDKLEDAKPYSLRTSVKTYWNELQKTTK